MRLFTALITLFMAFHQPAVAEVNILVIGQTKDSSAYSSGASPVSPFNPTQVVAELTSILEGGGHGQVNVTFEDAYGTQGDAAHTTLFSWFHFPFPADIEKTTRWPNLRGEQGTAWDYVVLIGDAYCIEHLPGFYALGVSEIGKEVAKGTAETVLLMPWPARGSTRTVDHYREVVYRVGRSGGYAVAPAALAWEASGEVASSENHPTATGAYIAAATLYSRLFKQSASASTYTVDDRLADLAHTVVRSNRGATQYTGPFSSPHPHSAQFNTNRDIRHSITATSTERQHMDMLRVVMDACGVEHDDYFSHRYDTNDPGTEEAGWPPDAERPIDFNLGKFFLSGDIQFNVNPAYWKRAYTFHYQGYLGSNDIGIGKIASHDMNAGVLALRHAPHVGAAIPRSVWAMLHRIDPDLKQNGSGNHLSNIAVLPNSTFIYTCDSGRCPLTPEPPNPSAEWNAMKVGYQAGWIMSRLQVRAPGFRVLPSAADKHEINNYSATGTEDMTVEFIFEPRAPVTVHLSSSNPDVIDITPGTLTFTPANHDVAQRFTVSIADGVPDTEEDITVDITTTSADEVYDHLSDHWAYTARAAGVSSLPAAVDDTYWTGINGTLTAAVDNGVLANDITHPHRPVTRITLEAPAANGTLDLHNDGSFTYTPDMDFEGPDSFSYRMATANGSSETATATIAVSDLDPGLILWYDFEDLDGRAVVDSTVYGFDGTVNPSIPRVAGVTEGTFGVDLNGGTIDIPVRQKMYDLLDREISIAFWGYLDPVTGGSSHSTLLEGTKTYGDKTFLSLRIRFLCDLPKNESRIFWENGIYTQKGRNGTYNIVNTGGHSAGKIPLTPDVLYDRWAHWTFARSRDNGGFFRVYKDGILAFEGDLAGLNGYGLVDEMDELVLGPSFKGRIDDFRIYNRELSSSEIAQIMLETAPPPPQAWTGAGGNRLWATPQNWSAGTVPGVGAPIEINTGDVIDIAQGVVIPPLSVTTFRKGEMSIGASADLKLGADSVFKIDGGRLTRDFAAHGENTTLGGPGSVLEMHSGSIQYRNAPEGVVSFMYGDMIVHGGTIDLSGQARLYGALTIRGGQPAMTIGSLGTFPGSSLHFELDASGVSPVTVQRWASLAKVAITVDGAAYRGGAATIPLLTAQNLASTSSSVRVSGFEERGYSAEVEQDQGTHDVNLIITVDPDHMEGHGPP